MIIYLERNSFIVELKFLVRFKEVTISSRAISGKISLTYFNFIFYFDLLSLL